MFAVIGLGQAGSNIAEEAQKQGYLSGAINYSQKDLDSVNVSHKLRLLGSEGVGKKRDEAIQLFQAQWEDALSFIKDNFANAQVIAFTFSLSGGSGSGISPILLEVALNTMPDSTFIALPIIPEVAESVSAQINTLKAFEELSQLSIATFPIDNQQTRNVHPSIGKNMLLEITNKSAISLLDTISSYTDKHSKNGNFDKEDLLTILNNPGIGLISEVCIAALNQSLTLTPESVAEKVRHSWSNSVFTPIESNHISKAAIIFDGQESLMEYIRHDLIFTPMPLELFDGNYHEHTGKIVSIITGLPWSLKRLYDIEKSINTRQEQLVTSGLDSSFQSKVSSLNQQQKNTDRKSVLDILSKYKH
ncbi:hypothetical protein GRF59_14640 [Paenibacillus sp. HJL G12]|uniref:Tubulin/FtsZ GTPase domain-containing protein n=1 Tax=Paenibacillus dendrobii TaxID=2691084 RepID=A0A7X3LGK7_9BACL|nr:hypothetical protein [Paenibacillus dendrobii]